MSVFSDCGQCYSKEESQKDCLWDQLESQLLWKCLLWIFANYFSHSIFTWGVVVWISFVYFVFYYDVQSRDHALSTCCGKIRVVRLVRMEFLGTRKEMQPLLELLSSTTICYIRKTWWSSIFHQVIVSPFEAVCDSWVDMVHTRTIEWFYCGFICNNCWVSPDYYTLGRYSTSLFKI